MGLLIRRSVDFLGLLFVVFMDLVFYHWHFICLLGFFYIMFLDIRVSWKMFLIVLIGILWDALLQMPLGFHALLLSGMAFIHHWVMHQYQWDIECTTLCLCLGVLCYLNPAFSLSALPFFIAFVLSLAFIHLNAKTNNNKNKSLRSGFF